MRRLEAALLRACCILLAADRMITNAMPRTVRPAAAARPANTTDTVDVAMRGPPSWDPTLESLATLSSDAEWVADTALGPPEWRPATVLGDGTSAVTEVEAEGS